MFWQLLVIMTQISIGTGQCLPDNDCFKNPFASIEPSTNLTWTTCDDSTASSGFSSDFVYECARLLVRQKNNDSLESYFKFSRITKTMESGAL